MYVLRNDGISICCPIITTTHLVMWRFKLAFFALLAKVTASSDVLEVSRVKKMTFMETSQTFDYSIRKRKCSMNKTGEEQLMKSETAEVEVAW